MSGPDQANRCVVLNQSPLPELSRRIGGGDSVDPSHLILQAADVGVDVLDMTAAECSPTLASVEADVKQAGAICEPGTGGSVIADERRVVDGPEGEFPGMAKAAGFSIATQGLSSAGNFVVSLMLIRLISIEALGYYTFFFAVAALGSSFAISATGYIYAIFLPRYALIKRTYQENYNGFNFLVTIFTSVSASVVAESFVHSKDELLPLAIPLFLLSFISVENLRLQASANGRHALMFFVELGRQLAVIGAFAFFSWRGAMQLGTLMIAQGLAGLTACTVLMIAFGSRVSFGRLAWVSRRHMAYARFLLPSTLIGFFHTSGIQLLVARQFGFNATGLLRLAELPFMALNPIRQSLALFLPRAMHHFKNTKRTGKGRLLLHIALASTLTFSAIASCTWIGAKLMLPIIAGVEYPGPIGMIFGVTYVFGSLVTAIQIYLNILNRTKDIFNQTVAGSVVALLTYFGTCSSIGFLAAPLAMCACFLVMVIYGVMVLAGQYNVEKEEADRRPTHELIDGRVRRLPPSLRDIRTQVIR
jgi:O-antigen/teichoic acid export membrane protein